MCPACKISLILDIIVIVFNEWQIMKLFIIQMSPASCSEAPLIIDLLSVIDSYKATGSIIVSYIVILIFLASR